MPAWCSRTTETVSLYVGTQSNGQGHETVYATFLSDHTGIPVEAIRIVQGDSDLIPQGGGTGGSRSVTVQSTATLATATTIRKQFAQYLADKTGTDGVEFDDERFRIPGSNETPTMLEVARMARDDGRNDLLDVQERITLEARSFPNGCHVAEVEIDPETGQLSVDRYTVTDDFGNLINPMLAEGQVHGGVAQGLGQAITEHVVYDDEGQLLTASFMDYGMPPRPGSADDPFHDRTCAVPLQPDGHEGLRRGGHRRRACGDRQRGDGCGDHSRGRRNPDAVHRRTCVARAEWDPDGGRVIPSRRLNGA